MEKRIARLFAGHLRDALDLGDTLTAQILRLGHLLFERLLTGLHLVLTVLEFFQLAVKTLFLLLDHTLGALDLRSALAGVALRFLTDLRGLIARFGKQVFAVSGSAGLRFLNDVLGLLARFLDRSPCYSFGNVHARRCAADHSQQHSQDHINAQNLSLLKIIDRM